MSKRKSDALQALAVEVAELDLVITAARADAEITRQEFVAARQTLDAKTQRCSDLEARQAATRRALSIIQERDQVSDDTVGTLIARAVS